MGEVYRAHDARLARDVALKILPPELAKNVEALRRFEQEARAASALNHPNIVTIYDIGHTDDRAWIAMELVDGTDLRTLAARDPLSVKDALRLAVKIADGLAAAHDRGIVHRDLKPENVMVTADGFVKILDFGLAKQVRTASADDTTMPHTSPGAVFGTVCYMSPEQASGREMDHRADQFSFGVMLYEMLTRVRPFDRDTKPETMTAIIREDVAPASSIDQVIPYDLDRVLSRCLSKNPRERYASTRDLARDLREIRDGLTLSSPKVRSTSGPPRAASERRIHPRSVIAAALVLAVVAGGIAMWVRRSRVEAGQRVTSLAVMPFRDLTATSDGRILADGISELIATRLADVPGLRVSSPFSGASLSDDDDVATVARRRSVHAVVRGTVQRGGSDVRVTYALVDAASGSTLVSNTLTREATDLFALEDAVAEDLVRALGRQSASRAPAQAYALGAEDQRHFIEAVGLLQRVKDERSVDRAITSLEGILRNSRESGAVNALLGRALLYKAALSRRPALIEQATVYATRGVTLSAENPDAHITLGRLHLAAGRHADAVASFQRALGLRANDPDAVLGLAEAYEGEGRGADAEAMYRKAIELRPDAPSAHTKYGVFCYGRGRYQDAVAHFRKSTEIAPDFSHAWANLGAALQALGRSGEAMAAYQKSLAIEPTAAGWSNLGTLQFSNGQYAEAQKSYERATDLAPSDPLLWANLGDACLAAGAPCANASWQQSIAAARHTLEVTPGDAVLRAIYASTLAKAGQPEPAQSEIRRALEADPMNPLVLYHAAVVSSVRGSTDSAVSWLERAVAAGYPAADVARDPAFSSLSRVPAFEAVVRSKL